MSDTTPIYKLKTTYIFIVMIVVLGIFLYCRYEDHKLVKQTKEVEQKKVEFEKKLEEIMPSSYVSKKRIDNIPNPFVTEWLDRPKDMMSANLVSHMLKTNNFT